MECRGINAYADGDFACARNHPRFREHCGSSRRPTTACRLTHAPAEPAGLGAVAAVAAGLQLRHPGGARTESSSAARCRRRPDINEHSRIPDHGAIRRWPLIAPLHRPSWGCVAEPLTVDPLTGISVTSNPQHRPRPGCVGELRARSGPRQLVTARSCPGSPLRRPHFRLARAIHGRRQRAHFDVWAHRGGRGVDVHRARRHVGELVRRTHLLLLRFHEGRLQRPGRIRKSITAMCLACLWCLGQDSYCASVAPNSLKDSIRVAGHGRLRQ